MKRFAGLLLIVLLVGSMAFALVACDKGGGRDYTIVYVGDSIAEALIGPSPLGERDNYGYYALLGKINNFKYYNHSVSGHKTSGGMAGADGLLEMLCREDENAVLMKTHLQQADMIHISVLGNNMLQYNLGLMILEVADPEFEAKYEAGKGADAAHKTLINALEEGSIGAPVVRKSVEKFDAQGNPEDVEFAFPPTYRNIGEIVDRLRALNPDAKIVFQKVYNPVYEGCKHLSAVVRAKLAEIDDTNNRFGGGKIDTIQKVRRVADYLLAQLNGMLDKYLAEHPNAFTILDARAEFERVTQIGKDGSGNVDLSEDSLGRSLIYADWTHPSNFGHAVIAGLSQKLFDELGISSPDALSNYKAIRVDQINRLYSKIDGFDAQKVIGEINGAQTFFDVTMAYFSATDGYTPIY